MEYRVCFYRVGFWDAVHVHVESKAQAMLVATRLVRDDGRFESRRRALKCMVACFEVIPPPPLKYSLGLNKNYVPGSVETYDHIKR